MGVDAYPKNQAEKELRNLRREMLVIFSSVIPTPEGGYTGEPYMLASDARTVCRELAELRTAREQRDQLLTICDAMIKDIDGSGEEACWCIPAGDDGQGCVCEACQMRALIKEIEE